MNTSHTRDTVRRSLIASLLVMLCCGCAPVTATQDVSLTTTNRLLRNNLPEFYPGAYGVKTGTSDQAGANLVSAATKAGKDIIAVVLGSDPDGAATGDRFSDSRALLNFGF